jgi:hypothetical protein
VHYGETKIAGGVASFIHCYRVAALCPLWVDSVEKLENRGASKISQMESVDEFSYCKALQNRYERQRVFLR